MSTKKLPVRRARTQKSAAAKAPAKSSRLTKAVANGKKDAPSLPQAITAADAYRVCPVDKFGFSDTGHFDKSHDIISQDRAVRAINLGLGIRKPGYNIYVAGIQGTGKTSVIKSFLEKWSTDSKPPNDWVYVYNFTDQEAPRTIELAPGGGRKLKKHMESVVKTLREEIPKALQSEDYENAVNAYLSASNERKAKLYSDLEKMARSIDFIIKSTRMGIETIPIVDGRSLSEKEYGKLSEDEREKIEERRSQLEPEVLDFARKVRGIEQETSQYVETLRNDLGQSLVGSVLDPVSEEYKDNETISGYLNDVRQHILDNLLEFVETESAEESSEWYADERDPFRKYRVNVFVDNTNTTGAPVIIETNPTYYNLFGRIEKNVEHGMYLTDFTMIKAGAVHRANKGYLVLNAMDIFKTPSIWDTLKRVLKNRQGFIEDMGEQYSLLPTSGLRPVPIPLDIKVILIGNDEIYHTLYDIDEDFHKIFKVKADFDYRMPRNDDTVYAYASFIATRTQVENLLPFDRDGVAAVVEFGSRLVEDQRFLSTQFGEIKDLTIESDYVAREENTAVVSRRHVERALDQKFHRLNLVEEQLLEMVKQEDILLTVDGERVGQVNGLAVYDMGDYSFGKLGRITCTISTNDEGVFNIERMSKLSGKIHDKGIHILTSFLNAVLAKTRSLGLASSVCFEQSYGIIDGDSATVAELVAILSAMAEIPVRQNIAMTGSLDQFGQVQPVGGINEKVEGFFKTSQLIGKGDSVYTVLIPHQNVPNLMLHENVRRAMEAGKFRIHPIHNINEVFELATGVALGFQDVHGEDNFAPNSALARIAKRLEKLHKKHEPELKKVEKALVRRARTAAKPKAAKSRKVARVGKPKKSSQPKRKQK